MILFLNSKSLICLFIYFTGFGEFCSNGCCGHNSLQCINNRCMYVCKIEKKVKIKNSI